MAGLERFDFARDPEQLAEEVLDIRRQRYHEFGLRFRRQRGRIGARLDQAGMEINIRLRQLGEKGGIQALHARALVKLVKGQAEA